MWRSRDKWTFRDGKHSRLVESLSRRPAALVFGPFETLSSETAAVEARAAALILAEINPNFCVNFSLTIYLSNSVWLALV